MENSTLTDTWQVWAVALFGCWVVYSGWYVQPKPPPEPLAPHLDVRELGLLDIDQAQIQPPHFWQKPWSYNLIARKNREASPSNNHRLLATRSAEILYVSRGEQERCFEAARQRVPDLEGSWRVLFVIESDGTATDVAFLPRPMTDSNFELCLAESLRHVTFPRPKRRTVARRTFTFRPT